MVPCLVSHAPSEREEKVLNPGLALLHEEQGTPSVRPSLPDTERHGTHLELLHFLLELVHRQLPYLVDKALELLYPRVWHERRDRHKSLV